MAQQPIMGRGFLIMEASRSHSDTSHSVGFLWTNDQADAETSTLQHTILTRGRHIHASGGIRTRNPSKRVAADPPIRPRISYILWIIPPFLLRNSTWVILLWVG